MDAAGSIDNDSRCWLLVPGPVSRPLLQSVLGRSFRPEIQMQCCPRRCSVICWVLWSNIFLILTACNIGGEDLEAGLDAAYLNTTRNRKLTELIALCGCCSLRMSCSQMSQCAGGVCHWHSSWLIACEVHRGPNGLAPDNSTTPRS